MARTILVLAANPKDTSRLRLEEEIREIDNGFQRAKRRDDFILKQKLAVRQMDVRRAMLDEKPSIVHFCGHGHGEEGIAFENETGNASLISAEALSGFFELFSDEVECVVLNACYSAIQANAIARHIDYVVGMSRTIGDVAAIEFAIAFYDALGAGKSVEYAYRLACNAIQWKGTSEFLTPVLISKKALAEQKKPTTISHLTIPAPDRNFHCYRIGNIEIPAMTIVGSPETPFTVDEVSIQYRPHSIEDDSDYPQALKDARTYLIEECKRRFSIKDFKDNTLIRLDDITQYPEDDDDRRGGLLIELSLTKYSSLLATNAALDVRVIPPSEPVSQSGVNQTLREAYGRLPYSDLSKSIFANAPGVEVILVSRNKSQFPEAQVLIRKRSNKVHIYQEHYQASASGYISLVHRDRNDNPNPFITSITEARQEIADGLMLSPEDYKLIGIALHWHGLYPAFYGYIETDLPVDDLLGDFKRDAFEGDLFAIPFTPKSVLQHVANEKWTAISALATISSVLAFFPRLEVEEVAKKLPTKTAIDFLSSIERG